MAVAGDRAFTCPDPLPPPSFSPCRTPFFIFWTLFFFFPFFTFPSMFSLMLFYYFFHLLFRSSIFLSQNKVGPSENGDFFSTIRTLFRRFYWPRNCFFYIYSIPLFGFLFLCSNLTKNYFAFLFSG